MTYKTPFIDINECAANKELCHVNARCINMSGSFRCECDTGFEGDGQQCFDVDECINNPCSENSNCVNFAGSYECICNAGFTGNNCADINECADNKCANNAICTNTLGGFECACKNGYVGDGLSICIDANEGCFFS